MSHPDTNKLCREPFHPFNLSTAAAFLEKYKRDIFTENCYGLCNLRLITLASGVILCLPSEPLSSIKTGGTVTAKHNMKKTKTIAHNLHYNMTVLCLELPILTKV